MNDVNYHYILINDELVEENDHALPPGDADFEGAPGVYETLRVEKGSVLFCKEHLDRLFRSARILGINHPFSLREIVRRTDFLIRRNNLEEGLIRLIIHGQTHPLLLAKTKPLPHYSYTMYRQGVAVISYQGERFLPEAKSSDCLVNTMAMKEAREKDAFEAILVDHQGHLREGSRSNLFLLSGEELITPGHDVLLGVTRGHILTIAGDLGLKLSQREIFGDFLETSPGGSLFLTGTSIGALPISTFDGKKLPVDRELITTLNERLKNLAEFSVSQYRDLLKDCS